MAIIKCKMCGGSIEISADKTYGTCDSCGSTMTFPRVSDEQRVNLFNRANHFRRQNEFDKAIAAYERILEQDNTDAEAHWGVVLSRYGIEYVEDPVSHERIPTCHRVQLDSILTDADYLSAKENAPDSYSAGLYEKEAKQIAEIQKGILAISAQEEPYDVFICYKESTDGGIRTKDSTLAQEIYYQLTNDGYKVFFSRITLEDKLGKQYEPYIFAALNSAKVMLVIGTKPEYLNAVWVKNEWSRYLALMKQDRSKLLIPCYRDMDPYDLPEELSALQSQDMSKIGFMQDLLHGIKKVLDSGKEEAGPANGSGSPGIKSLLTRARLFLEDGDFASANEYADKVLDIEPKYAPAYIVKVQVKEKVRKESDLAYCKHSLTNNSDYQKAVRFADPQNKAIYESYNQTILTRLQEESREKLYRDTVLKYRQSEDDRELYKIAAEFDHLKDYKDSAQQAKFCREKAQRIIAARAQREAEIQAEQERIRAEKERKKEEAHQRFEQAQLERKRREEQERIEEERRKKRNKKTATIVIILLIIAAIAGGAWYFVLRPSDLYEQAGYARMEGKYDEAISALEEVKAIPAFSTFAGIGGFEDAETIIKQCEADKLFAAGDYIGAYEIYSTLDSRYQTNEDRYAAIYQSAVEQMENGEFEAAIASLNAILNYSDSAARIGEFYYADAQAKLTDGDAEAARAALVLAGEYSDSKDMIAAIDTYNSAIAFMAESKWAEARACLSGLTILDSAAKLEECYAVDYTAAEELYNTGDIAGAHDAFLAISEYSDSAARAAQIETDYASAAAMVEEGRFDEAIAMYTSLGNYQDSVHNGYVSHYKKGLHLWETGEKVAAEAELVYVSESYDVEEDLLKLRTEIADDAFAVKEYNVALEYYVMLPQTDELKAKEYQLAQTCYDEGAFRQAVAAYEVLGQYELSVSRLPVARYAYAAQLFDNGEYQQAAEQFKLLGSTTDSIERANQATYLYGKQLLEGGEYDAAKEVFLSIEEYQDSTAMARDCEYLKAASIMETGNYAEASKLFKAMQKYKDSNAQANECDYQLALIEMNAGNYDEARKIFAALATSDNYKDSAEMVKVCKYEEANLLYGAGNYASAEELYASILEYEDSAAKVQACRYEQGKSLYNSGDYNRALTYFTDLDYLDSETRAAQCHCELGKAYLTAGKTDAAAQEYAQATILPEAQEMLCGIGKDYAATNQNDKAITVLWSVRNYEPAQKLLVEVGELLLANPENANKILGYVACLIAGETVPTPSFGNKSFEEWLKESIAIEILPENTSITEAILLDYAKQLRAEQQYDTSIDVLESLIIKEDSISKEISEEAERLINEFSYEAAQAAYASGDWGNALLLYQQSGDYLDSKEQAANLRNFFDGCIATSSGHIVALKSDGTVLAIGSNMYGQSNVGEWEGIIKLATSGAHTLGLKHDGTVLQTSANKTQHGLDAWKNITHIASGGSYFIGINTDGNILTDGNFDESLFEGWDDLVSIAAASRHCLGLKKDGTVLAATSGSNHYGECNVENWSDIIAVEVGSNHSIGLKKDGTVVATGSNDVGQCNVEQWRDIVDVSACSSYTLGLTRKGTIVSTGSVPSRSNARGIHPEEWSNIIEIDCSAYSITGLRADGTVLVYYTKHTDVSFDIDNWKLWDQQDFSGKTVEEILASRNTAQEDTEDELPGSIETETVSFEEATIGSKGEYVKNLQQALIDQGFLSGAADGQFGKMTAEAVKKAQAAFGMEVTGIADSAFQNRLYSNQ